MAAAGVSQHEIARRLGINRRTVKRLLDADEPPVYRRAPAGSKSDRFEAVIQAWSPREGRALKPSDPAQKKAVQAAIRQVADDYLRDPNINSVGLGFKTVSLFDDRQPISSFGFR